LLLIDDAQEWDATAAGERLAELVRTAPERRLAVVVACDTDHVRHGAGDLVSAVVKGRRGVVLRPEPVDDGLLGAAMPWSTVEDLSGPGRGFWCWDGVATAVQVISATPH
jgi:S-DNA-T family DNA segregation ATPase FtsK/SpoIIIE